MIKRQQLLRDVGLFLGKDGSMTAVRTLMGLTMGALIGTQLVTSVPALSALGVGFVAFTGFAHWAIERGRQETMLDTYRTEISHMLGKDEKELTVADLKLATQGPHNPKGSTALRLGIEYFRGVRNFFITSQALTAAIMVPAMFAAVPYVGPALAGFAGLLYNRLFRTVENIHAFVMQQDVRDAIINDIHDINEQVAHGSPISAIKVLEVLVKADPMLQAAVKTRFHQPYENLSVAEKRKAVDFLNPKTDVVQITKDINVGRILPTELAFIAFDEKSGTPRVDVSPEIHVVRDKHNDKAWTAHLATPGESHTKQLDIEKLVENNPILH